MSDKYFGNGELSADDVAKAGSAVTLVQKEEYMGGTSYMDDIPDVSALVSGSGLSDHVPSDTGAYDLESISVPEFSDYEELPIREELPPEFISAHPEKHLHDSENAADYGGPEAIEVPEFSDTDELPLKKEEHPRPAKPAAPPDPFADPFGDPFPPRQRKKKKEPRDIVDVNVPEIEKDDGLLMTNSDSGPVRNPYADANFVLDKIDVPEFSDGEALPDIGPVYVKPSVPRKPKLLRRFEDDFPMPIKSTGGFGASAPRPPQPAPSVPRPAPAPTAPAPALTAPKPAPSPAPAPAAPEESGGRKGLFNKLFGKKK